MEVTVNNYQELLPTIIKDIGNADFISFDLEMSGLHSEPGSQPNMLDDVSARYAKVRDTATKFATLQVGMCMFFFDEESELYTAHPYNFYIFSRPPKNEIPDRRFLCQSASVDFLCRNHFDFNKTFYHGIPYLTAQQEATQRERIVPDESLLNQTDRSDIVLNEANQAFINDIFTQTDAFMLSSDRSINLNPCNAFQRRIIYQEVGKRYNNTLHIDSHCVKEGSHQKFLQIHRMTEEEKKAHIALKVANLERELHEYVGFRHVVDALIESKKILVGHNAMYDVAFIMSHFVSTLPEQIEAYKTSVHRLFPGIVDTKYISTTDETLQHQIASTMLEDLVRFLRDPRFVEPKIQLGASFSRYQNDGSTGLMFHEAGYDAYQTGVGFLKMMRFIEGEGKIPVSKYKSLLPYINKLYLARSDVPYLNLTGSEEKPNRPNVFFVTGFPKEWRTSDIISLFQVFGLINVRWIDNTSAMVTLQDATQSERVMPYFLLCDNIQPFLVTDYASYKSSWKCNDVSVNITPKRKEEMENSDSNMTPKKTRLDYLQSNGVIERSGGAK